MKLGVSLSTFIDEGYRPSTPSSNPCSHPGAINLPIREPRRKSHFAQKALSYHSGSIIFLANRSPLSAIQGMSSQCDAGNEHQLHFDRHYHPLYGLPGADVRRRRSQNKRHAKTTAERHASIPCTYNLRWTCCPSVSTAPAAPRIYSSLN